MKSRLVFESHSLHDFSKTFEEVSYWQYLKLRLDFKKWKLHRTMGRPVLMLRRKP